jgi:hypothetical protein
LPAEEGSRRNETVLVECYWPGVNEVLLREAAARAREAASNADGGCVALLGAWLVPSDEVAFLTFRGSPVSVREVSRRAGIPFDRLVEVIELEVEANGQPDGRTVGLFCGAGSPAPMCRTRAARELTPSFR